MRAPFDQAVVQAREEQMAVIFEVLPGVRRLSHGVIISARHSGREAREDGKARQDARSETQHGLPSSHPPRAVVTRPWL